MTDPRFRVLRGHPTEAETAALAVALTKLAESGETPAQPSPWLRAARVEGRGGPRIAAPGDLRATGR